MSHLYFFALNDRRDRQTELRTAEPLKSTFPNKQQKKEERLHSKRSPCEIMMTKFLHQNAVQTMHLVAMQC